MPSLQLDQILLQILKPIPKKYKFEIYIFYSFMDFITRAKVLENSVSIKLEFWWRIKS